MTISNHPAISYLTMFKHFKYWDKRLYTSDIQHEYFVKTVINKLFTVVALTRIIDHCCKALS